MNKDVQNIYQLYIESTQDQGVYDPSTGDCVWRVNGEIKYIEYKSGARAWFTDGFLHRVDGPAYIARDGYEMYFLNGVQLSGEELEKYLQKKAFTKEMSETKDAMFDPDFLNGIDQ